MTAKFFFSREISYPFWPFLFLFSDRRLFILYRNDSNKFFAVLEGPSSCRRPHHRLTASFSSPESSGFLVIG